MGILVVSLVVTIVGWFIIRSILIGQMSNVHTASGADEYLRRDTIHLTEERDTYLYTKVERRPKSKK